jgi:uncharacterized membrane protein
MTESTYRTLIKTISWRIIATIASFTISYLIIDNIMVASSIAGIQVIIHTILYYIHERVWISIVWGK